MQKPLVCTPYFCLEQTSGQNKHNLLENYVLFDLKRMQRHEGNHINNPTRAAQDDRILYKCLINYLSVTGKSKVNVKPYDYHVVNPPLPSRECLFKVLVREIHLDSNDISGMIRTRLSNLDRRIQEIVNDTIISVCRSGLRGPLDYSLLGGGIPTQSIG